MPYTNRSQAQGKIGYLELPSSEDENYKANTRKGVDGEYIPTAKSA